MSPADLRRRNTKLEKAIEKQACKWAESNGWLHYKMNVLGQRGWPDRVFIKKGKVLYVEFKAPGKEPNPLQTYRLNSLRMKGVSAFWVSSVLEFTSMLVQAEKKRDEELKILDLPREI